MRWIKQRFAHLRGKAAEQLAASYLTRQGLRFIARNYRCRQGEIDLIFQQGEVWVFIEVKFRENNAFGEPSEYFHAAKRKKFIRAMQHFMHAKRLNPDEVPHRIDLVAIYRNQIDWLQAV